MNQVKIKTTRDETVWSQGPGYSVHINTDFIWNGGTTLQKKEVCKPEAYVFSKQEKMYTLNYTRLNNRNFIRKVL